MLGERCKASTCIAHGHQRRAPNELADAFEAEWRRMCIAADQEHVKSYWESNHGKSRQRFIEEHGSKSAFWNF